MTKQRLTYGQDGLDLFLDPRDQSKALKRRHDKISMQ
jgi:hypothetical protein